MSISKLDYKASAERWNKYSHEYFNLGARQYTLVTNFSLHVSTFLLGFNILWFQATAEPITDTIRIFITCSIVFLVFSLIMGILDTTIVNRYYNEVGEYYEKLSEKMYHHILNTRKHCGNKYPNSINNKDLKYEKSPWLQKAQIGLLLLGITSSLLTGIFLLWGFG